MRVENQKVEKSMKEKERMPVFMRYEVAGSSETLLTAYHTTRYQPRRLEHDS
jgi:hypothetical protein